MQPMKPTQYKLVMKDDPQEFENQVNALLADGYVFMGEPQIDLDISVYVQGMIKMEPITPVQMPAVTKKENK